MSNSLSIVASPEQKFPVSFQDTGNDVTRFVEVIVSDSKGNFIDSFLLTHRTNGFYSREFSLQPVGVYDFRIFSYVDSTKAVLNADAYQKVSIRTDNPLGHGSREQVITICDDQGNPVAEALVFVTSDELGTIIVAGTKRTNPDGTVRFLLDPGIEYSFWVTKAGLTFNNPIKQVFA